MAEQAAQLRYLPLIAHHDLIVAFGALREKKALT
jgi:hypothetical protein